MAPPVWRAPHRVTQHSRPIQNRKDPIGPTGTIGNKYCMQSKAARMRQKANGSSPSLGDRLSADGDHQLLNRMRAPLGVGDSRADRTPPHLNPPGFRGPGKLYAQPATAESMAKREPMRCPRNATDVSCARRPDACATDSSSLDPAILGVQLLGVLYSM